MDQPVFDLVISLQDEVDEEELDRLTRQLCTEIDELDVESVELARDPQAPEGSKGVPIIIGSLVVGLASAGVFTGLIEVLKSWALRREGRTVTLKARVGQGAVELTYCPQETSLKDMAHFVDAIVGVLKQSATVAAPEGAGLTQGDLYAVYEAALGQLLEAIAPEQPNYQTALVYQQRLRENIATARRHGDYDRLRAERAEIIDQLNRLALAALGRSFNEICQQIGAG